MKRFNITVVALLLLVMATTVGARQEQPPLSYSVEVKPVHQVMA
jgi:hypothetical protein